MTGRRPSTKSDNDQQGNGARPAPPGGHPSRSTSSSQFGADTTDPSTVAPDFQSPSIQTTFRVPESPSQRAQDASKQAKVAIPRLKRTVDDQGETSSRDFKIACYYADGKRDRVKKQFGSMTEKVADYEKLLKDLATRVGEADAKLIRGTLEKETSYEADDLNSLQNSTLQSIEPVPDGEESGAESEASGDAGSTGALDRTDEDFTREEARRTGFMGKNSEITWLQRLKYENQAGDEAQSLFGSKKNPGDDSAPLQETETGYKVGDTSYHLDDFAVTTFEAVDPYEYPTPDVARHLFNAYMTRVHPTFPIVGKANLTTQFNKFVSGQVQRPPEKWLAIINMIFAIGAKYSHLTQAEWKGDERDHLIYFTRARLLSVSSDTLFQHPDLQSIQIIGLISLYLMCISQINRAWNMIGLAIRWATALGLNMRNDSTELKNSLKEIRYRVWWALYSLEHRLCSMTGRVNCILDDHCTTPLPVPLEEHMFDTDEGAGLLSKETQQRSRAPAANSHSPSNGGSSNNSASRSRSTTKGKGTPSEGQSPSNKEKNGDLQWASQVQPNASLYFLHLVQLMRLTQNIFQELYNPTAIEGTWSDIQAVIQGRDESLEAWCRNLPPSLDPKRNQRDREFYEYRLSLGFAYYSSKMMTHRPCLCRLDRKIPHQSNKSLAFNRNSATMCVDAAKDMLRLIPDEPNAVGLIKVGPWWNILHWLVQATTVLMLELSFRVHHMPEEAHSILEAAKKGVRWLHALGEDNLSARRAWSMCNRMLHDAASKIGQEINDLPQNPPGHEEQLQNHDSAMGGVSQPAFSGNWGGGQMFQTSGPNQYPTYPLDQLMHFDQFSGMDPNMQFNPNMNMNFGATDAELEFMSNAYHQGQDHGTDHARRETRN
ncbi:putative transcriptional regulatory protein [Cyphellophora attinorum]|uniref:Putative transcriptional regulatory protein n=1 Tax=Cyphellophora attinorum TaxID=1664694 RepID=A0A0N1I035_9EURO|nr:putative transcriptional regulatory protein [Phialophora attinorum]KPI44660.1 putative transcriptional regulatory protein [Phialophora attinorum]